MLWHAPSSVSSFLAHGLSFLCCIGPFSSARLKYTGAPSSVRVGLEGRLEKLPFVVSISDGLDFRSLPHLPPPAPGRTGLAVNHLTVQQKVNPLGEVLLGSCEIRPAHLHGMLSPGQNLDQEGSSMGELSAEDLTREGPGMLRRFFLTCLTPFAPVLMWDDALQLVDEAVFNDL